jgi:hypothetical protein
VWGQLADHVSAAATSRSWPSGIRPRGFWSSRPVREPEDGAGPRADGLVCPCRSVGPPRRRGSADRVKLVGARPVDVLPSSLRVPRVGGSEREGDVTREAGRRDVGVFKRRHLGAGPVADHEPDHLDPRSGRSRWPRLRQRRRRGHDWHPLGQPAQPGLTTRSRQLPAPMNGSWRTASAPSRGASPDLGPDPDRRGVRAAVDRAGAHVRT